MTAPERHIGDGGEIRCGDVMHGVSRRLCGGCSRLVDVVETDDRIVGSRMARPEGCGEVLERLDDIAIRDEDIIEPPPGWEKRIEERAARGRAALGDVAAAHDAAPGRSAQSCDRITSSPPGSTSALTSIRGPHPGAARG